MQTTCPQCGHVYDTDRQVTEDPVPVNAIIGLFIELFPKKPRPRKTAGVLAKLKTRWKDRDFRAGWDLALHKAAASIYLTTQASWFHFGWFVKNDDNFMKLINEVWKWKDEEIAKQDAHAHRQHARRRRQQEEDAILANYKQMALQPGMSHDDQVRLYDKAERELSSPTATAFGSWLQDLWAKQERGA